MGRKLFDRITAAGITQADLAKKVGISETYMSFIVRGLKNPTIEIVKRIAAALNCKIDDIV